MKTFVTGGTGLIGSHILLQLLREGKTIRAAKRSSSDTERVRNLFRHYTPEADRLFEKIEWTDLDLLNKTELENAFEGISEVYHCAAMVSFDPADDDRMMRFNVSGTDLIVDLCLEKKVKKLGFLSSVGAIGRQLGKTIYHLDENSEWYESVDNSPYARSKYQSEQIVLRGVKKGLKAAIINPVIVIGPGNWDQSSSKLFSTIWKGFPFYSLGSNSFVDVRDVAACIITLMEKEIFGERYIISASNLNYKDLFGLIAASLGKKKPSIPVNRIVGELAWRLNATWSFLSGKRPLITRATIDSARTHHYYDNRKIRDAINWNFIPIEKSILDTGKIFLIENKNN